MATSYIFESHGAAGPVALGVFYDQEQQLRRKLPGAATQSIELDPLDLLQLRFAFSPLWECLAAFRVYMNPNAGGIFTHWRRRISTAVSRADWKLLAGVFGPQATIPNLFFPCSAVAFPSLRDELDNLLRLPEDVVRAEIKNAFPSSIPSSLVYVLKKPSHAMSDFAEIIERFWMCALASDWTLMRAKLESELLYRARAFAVSGLAGLFEGLHKDVDFYENRLSIHRGSSWDYKMMNMRKSGLVIVPSVFSWPDVFFRVRPPWHPTLVYPCRGLADLWDAQVQGAATSLEKLIGQSCAKVIHFLKSPQTTLETATAIKLSTAAASEQITKLWRAGILERTRIGSRVFYCLNEKGMALLKAFSV